MLIIVIGHVSSVVVNLYGMHAVTSVSNDDEEATIQAKSVENSGTEDVESMYNSVKYLAIIIIGDIGNTYLAKS